MICQIKGVVSSIVHDERHIFVDILTASGVGYRVYLTASSSVEIDKEINLYTSYIVREDSQSLYGFHNSKERDFFELLLTVNGVGPKSALSLLSSMSMDEVAGCILNNDANALSKAPGLGKKGAQKIILELEGKVKDMGLTLNDVKKSVDSEKIKELTEALKALGFTGEILKAYVDKASKSMQEGQGVDELIKIVLKDN